MKTLRLLWLLWLSFAVSVAGCGSSGPEGTCCPISDNPSCGCFELGGTPRPGCSNLCDAPPVGWVRGVDDNGCPVWWCQSATCGQGSCLPGHRDVDAGDGDADPSEVSDGIVGELAGDDSAVVEPDLDDGTAADPEPTESEVGPEDVGR